MKHRMFLAAVFGAAAWLIATPDLGLAFGKKRGDDCAPPCPAPCAPAYTVQWVEKDVTVLEPVFKTKDVEVTVMKPVPVTKDVTYKVAVPKSKIEKREVVTMTRVAVKKPYEYWVNELVATKEKRTVVECVPTTKEVEVDVTTYATVAKEVETVVAVCKQVPVAPAPCGVTAGCSPCVPVCEPSCGGKKGLFGKRKHSCETYAGHGYAAPCGPQFTTVVEHVKSKATVYECVPTTKKVKQMVTTYANVSKEVTVDVWKCVPAKKVSEYTVWECVPVKSTVDVTVHFCEYVDKTEKVTYYECQPVKETVKHSYCEMVSVTKKVKVPVHVPCAAPAPVVAPCAPVACTPVCAVVPTCEKEKRKLFGRKSCGGCN